MMSGEMCTCGAKFLDAEDFRDHLPCPGSEIEQARERAERIERDARDALETAAAGIARARDCALAIPDGVAQAACIAQLDRSAAQLDQALRGLGSAAPGEKEA